MGRRRTKCGKRCNESGWKNGAATAGSKKLLDVYSRVDLPFFQLNENNSSSSKEADDETIEFRIRPRSVFSHSMCLVCMETTTSAAARRSSLTCDKCKMVSYCSIQHRTENRSSHRDLCNVLCTELGGIEAFRFPGGIAPDLYRSLRIKMMNLAEAKLQRRLELWEREIILYPPRVCRICRIFLDEDPDLLEPASPCPDCTMEYHCRGHALEHAPWCKDYRVFRRVSSMQHKHGYVDALRFLFPEVRGKTRRAAAAAANFDETMLDAFGGDSDRYRRIDAYTYAVISLSATAPLTTLFALEKTRGADYLDAESLRIDVIGAEFHFECSTLRVWEKFFLHYLPKLKILELEFTGAELDVPDGAPIELLSRVALCKRCNNEKRRIVVRFNERKLYHEVVDSRGGGGGSRDPGAADLVCLFNPGLYRETGYDGKDTWPKTIQRFCRARVPVLVTSYTEIEIPRDIERIRSISDIEILLEPQKNPFASVKPDRNFVSDDVAPLVYKNYCLSVIKGL